MKALFKIESFVAVCPYRVKWSKRY